MGSPHGLNEDFNISASRELTVAEIARIIWEACGEDPEDFALAHLPTVAVDVQRRWPSVEKARELLGWQSQIEVEDGIAATVEWLRDLRSGAERSASPADLAAPAPAPAPSAPGSTADMAAAAPGQGRVGRAL